MYVQVQLQLSIAFLCLIIFRDHYVLNCISAMQSDPCARPPLHCVGRFPHILLLHAIFVSSAMPAFK